MPGPQAPPSGNPPRIDAPIVKDEISGDDEDEIGDQPKILSTEEFRVRAAERALQLDFQQKSKSKQTKNKSKK